MWGRSLVALHIWGQGDFLQLFILFSWKQLGLFKLCLEGSVTKNKNEIYCRKPVLGFVFPGAQYSLEGEDQIGKKTNKKSCESWVFSQERDN